MTDGPPAGLVPIPEPFSGISNAIARSCPGIAPRIHPFWAPGFAMRAQSVLLTGAIILFGTDVDFLAYLESVKCIEASLASVMPALEPLLAAVLSVLVFGTVFGLFEWLGIAIVLESVLLLSNFGRFKEIIPSREYGKGLL